MLLLPLFSQSAEAGPDWKAHYERCKQMKEEKRTERSKEIRFHKWLGHESQSEGRWTHPYLHNVPHCFQSPRLKKKEKMVGKKWVKQKGVYLNKTERYKLWASRSQKKPRWPQLDIQWDFVSQLRQPRHNDASLTISWHLSPTITLAK